MLAWKAILLGKVSVGTHELTWKLSLIFITAVLINHERSHFKWRTGISYEWTTNERKARLLWPHNGVERLICGSGWHMKPGRVKPVCIRRYKEMTNVECQVPPTPAKNKNKLQSSRIIILGLVPLYIAVPGKSQRWHDLFLDYVNDNRMWLIPIPEKKVIVGL